MIDPWQAGERYILIDKNESNLERWVYFVVANVERLICPWAVTRDNLLLPLGEQISLSLDIKIKCHACLMCRSYFMSTSCFLKQLMIFIPWTLRYHTFSWNGISCRKGKLRHPIQLFFNSLTLNLRNHKCGGYQCHKT